MKYGACAYIALRAVVNGILRSSGTYGQPVISVDTKRKELVGNYQNKVRQWLAKGKARRVNGYDFPDPSVPRAYPYGVYNIGNNKRSVNVGTDHNMAAFAVASIQGLS